MSVRLVTEAVTRFLKSADAEVLCISGKWGVGKTHTWDKVLKQLARENLVGLKRYSYVSLFGQNTLESLKFSIFENIQTVAQLAAEPETDERTIRTSILNFKAQWRNAYKFLESVFPKLGEYVSMDKVYFLAVRNQIVCIDDLERVGAGLTAKDILGLASFLKEQRKCKVVFLLNDEELNSDDEKEFKMQLEKVSDIEMRFAPTPEEAAATGIDMSKPYGEKFARITRGLGIVNIRVIRKTQRLIARLAEIVADLDPRILDSAITTMAILGWVHYQPKEAPTLEFVKDYNPYGDLFGEGKTESEQQKGWRVLLKATDFTHFDEFDGHLSASVKSGYFDADAVRREAEKLQRTHQLQDQDRSFHNAWEVYHNSFNTTEEEVLDGIFSAFKRCVSSIAPMNLDGTTSLFREFGRDAQADEMIAYYMSERQEPQDFYDPSRSVFMQFKDPAVTAAFAERLATFHDERSPESILIQIARNGGWNPEDISALKQTTADQFYAIFKHLQGDDLRIAVSQALKFKNTGGLDEETRAISDKAAAALKRIGAESKINKRRVKGYGIVVDDAPESDKVEQKF